MILGELKGRLESLEILGNVEFVLNGNPKEGFDRIGTLEMSMYFDFWKRSQFGTTESLLDAVICLRARHNSSLGIPTVVNQFRWFSTVFPHYRSSWAKSLLHEGFRGRLARLREDPRRPRPLQRTGRLG